MVNTIKFRGAIRNKPQKTTYIQIHHRKVSDESSLEAQQQVLKPGLQKKADYRNYVHVHHMNTIKSSISLSSFSVMYSINSLIRWKWTTVLFNTT